MATYQTPSSLLREKNIEDATRHDAGPHLITIRRRVLFIFIDITIVIIVALLSVLIVFIVKYKGLTAETNAQSNFAVCVLYGLKNPSIRGTAVFYQESSNLIRLAITIMGLSPGDHGLHIHEFGDNRSPDGATAGLHYNPSHLLHGCPTNATTQAVHVGDLGNLVADNKGNAVYNILSSNIKLSGVNSIIGRSLLVSANVDDCMSQPDGKSGSGVAQCVIGVGLTDDPTLLAFIKTPHFPLASPSIVSSAGSPSLSPSPSPSSSLSPSPSTTVSPTTSPTLTFNLDGGEYGF